MSDGQKLALIPGNKYIYTRREYALPNQLDIDEYETELIVELVAIKGMWATIIIGVHNDYNVFRVVKCKNLRPLQTLQEKVL